METSSPTTNNIWDRLGLPWWAIVALAALGAPRVVLHDLDVIESGGPVNSLFVFVPVLVWIAVVVWRRPPSPLLTLVAVGGVYGVFVAVGHIALWNQSFDDDDPPKLGGNLEDELPNWLEQVVLRVASGISSLVTGLAVGAIAGFIAMVIVRIWKPSSS